MRSRNVLSLVGGCLLVLAIFGGALASPWGQALEVAVYLPLVQRPEMPTATLTLASTATSTITPTPTATLPGPTSTATVTLPGPTPTATATESDPNLPPENWLARLNYYRALASLPAVTENTDWSSGDYLHSRYCVKNDYIGHSEDSSNPWYTADGHLAAQNGNVTVSSNVSRPDWAAIDSWMTGPFHAVGMIDPGLAQAGYGSYREADGGWQMAATLDVLRGLGSVPASVTFPVMWPGNDATVYLSSYGGGESPNPISGCAGYATPVGLPVILQIGSGGVTPSVTAHTVKQNGADIEHCIFDETNYTNSDSQLQSLGRNVLAGRDAIVIIPRQPLVSGSQYTFSVTTNGNTYTWSFNVASSVQRAAFSQDEAWMR